MPKKSEVITDGYRVGRGPLILYYHHVGNPVAGTRYEGLYVTPRHLLIHIRALMALGYQFKTLRDALASTENAKTACITFDDGYVDNISHGLPVLKKLGVPATVFVVTSDVGKNHLHWEESGNQTPEDLMDWDELKTLKKAGWEIGSHAHEHRHLDRLDEKTQIELIKKSFDEIESHLGEKPFSFAYPYGHFNHYTLAAVKSAGFHCAVTTKSGVNLPNNSAMVDRFHLQRIGLKGQKPRHYLRSLLNILRYTI